MKKQIFYVEDNLSLYEAFKFSVEDYADVTNAANLEDALEIIKKEKFDVYISDGNYPLRKNCSEEEGAWEEFYRNLKLINKEAEFIALTNSPRMETKAKFMSIKSFDKFKFNQLIEYLKNKFKD